MYRLHLSKNADYCVDPNTLVLTTDLKWVKISTLVPGDKLIGFTDEATGISAKRKFEESVVETVSKVRLPSYRLTLEDGTMLTSSSDHPWLVMNGNTGRWCVTSKLQESDRYPKPSRLARLFNVWAFDDSRDAGYLAAALDGEGWLTHKENPRNDRSGHDNWVFTLGFSQRNNEMLTEVERILHTRGIEYRRKFSGSTEQIVWSKRNQIVELIGTIRPHRLLPHVLPTLGRIQHYPVSLKYKDFIGDADLISIKTSTRTFIANGFASHNSPANVAGPGSDGLMTRIWDKATRLMNLCGFKVYLRTNDNPKTLWQKLLYALQGRVVVIDEIVFTEPRVPKHESIDDTLLDNSVYSIIFRLFRAGKWGH